MQLCVCCNNSKFIIFSPYLVGLCGWYGDPCMLLFTLESTSAAAGAVTAAVGIAAGVSYTDVHFCMMLCNAAATIDSFPPCTVHTAI